MNHDMAHCMNYNQSCPNRCYRATLTKDLENRRAELRNIATAWANFRDTDECPKDKKAVSR